MKTPGKDLYYKIKSIRLTNLNSLFSKSQSPDPKQIPIKPIIQIAKLRLLLTVIFCYINRTLLL